MLSAAAADDEPRDEVRRLTPATNEALRQKVSLGLITINVIDRWNPQTLHVCWFPRDALYLRYYAADKV